MTPAVLQLAHTGAISLGAAAEALSLHGARPRHHRVELKQYVLARDGYACQICGREGEWDDLQLHHLLPVQWGGSSAPDNLATLCPECHRRLHREHRTFRGPRTFDDPEGGDGL